MKRIAPILGISLIAVGLGTLGYAAFAFAQQQLAFNEIPVVNAPLVQPAVAMQFAEPSAVATAIPSSPSVIAAPASLTSVIPTKPPTLSTPLPLPTLALRALNPARIVIPAIRVDARVVEMSWMVKQESNGEWSADWDLPPDDVGHSVTSANPGEIGNVVLSGHNNLGAAVFKKLYTLKAGNEITLFNAAGQAFLYRVSESYLVREEGQPWSVRQVNARVMLPTSDARLTLISCYPEWSNTYRAIVIALPVGPMQ